MALVYCEICGVLIKGPQSHAPIPEGVICDGCFESRRAVVTHDEPPPPDAATMVQFNCCYCRSLLRLRAVGKRTRIKCPKCTDAFYLHPDGRIESRLEGNTTAIISSDQALGSLTPPTGQAPAMNKTQPMSREALNKTQPLPREAPPPPPVSSQQALLEGLKPKKLDFLEGVPERDRSAPLVDTDAYESSSSGPLDLMPHDKGPGDARPALRPSEEGKLDLDAEGLRRKTQKYQQNALAGRTTTKKHKQPEPEPAPAPADDEPRSKRTTEKRARTTEKHARKAEKPEREADKDAKREERERRAAEAARKAQELAAEEAKKSLGALSLTAIAVVPALLALLLLSMTTRGTGFAVRGAFGERMKDVGQGVDRGVRSLGGMVNPYLPPEYRLPQVADSPR